MLISTEDPADTENVVREQLLALRDHVEIHQCPECRKLLHELANSIHVAVFDLKLAKKSRPLSKQSISSQPR